MHHVVCEVSYNAPSYCSDTVTRSALFCSIATTIESCKAEGLVDVFQVVKALRVHRPGAILTVVSVPQEEVEVRVLRWH